MTDSPPCRTNSKGNLRHFIQEGVVGNLRRRLSSGFHNNLGSPPKKVRVFEKGREKVRTVRGVIARSSWGSSHHSDQQQHVKPSPSRPLSQLSIAQSNLVPLPMPASHSQEGCSAELESERELDADHTAASMSPSVSIMPSHNGVDGPEPGMDIDKPAVWNYCMMGFSNPESNSHIPGQPSATLPSGSEDNDLLIGLDDSTLRGTHLHRYQRTVDELNELSAVASGGMMPAHGPFTPVDALYKQPEPTNLSPQATGGGKGKSPNRRQTSKATTPANEAQVKRPCPWPECTGTKDTKEFESNRLKEHLRRVHLLPYMCGFPECNVRKGDKHQISRHRAKKHPKAPNKCYKDQDVDRLAASQLEALKKRGIEYERIAEICNAKCIEDLRDSDVPHVYSSSSPTIRIQDVPPSVPVSPPTAGLGPPRNLQVQTDLGFSGMPTTDPSTPSSPIDDIVNLLVPYIYQLNLATSREMQEQHLQNVLHQLGAATRERLERRVFQTSMDMSYTQLLGTQDLMLATPPLTRTTSTSASYASLSLPVTATAGGSSEFEAAAAMHQKLWQSQDPGDTVFEPRSDYANGGLGNEWRSFGFE